MDGPFTIIFYFKRLNSDVQWPNVKSACRLILLKSLQNKIKIHLIILRDNRKFNDCQKLAQKSQILQQASKLDLRR
ncbi:hypothetical protein BpHYR1_039044 [Brachionus plicatilis]|uniref:Uncharacterized protein n=1 Tax=Brachionus plicatilis TaxID=10195 RepID=A0A3M7R405_BRAPC|nr:hypothetical protein BpHYR1_039044 [Brachionus plicatilis]